MLDHPREPSPVFQGMSLCHIPSVSFCHPRLDRGSSVFGFFMRGFAPARRGSFGYAQDRLFCFGKRTQNHWRPGVALRVPVPRSLLFWLRNSLRSDSPRPQIDVSGPGRSHARRRREMVA